MFTIRTHQVTFIIILAYLVLFPFLPSETVSINLFPIVDRSILDRKEAVREVHDVNLGVKIPEVELIMISRKIRPQFEENEKLYVVISVKTDPVGNEEANRRLGFHLSNWIGQLFISSGIPSGRVAITEPEEDKRLLETSFLDFKQMQTCRIFLVEGSDLLKYSRMLSREVGEAETVLPITILSPREGVTDKGFHILKGLVEPRISVLAVTVNNEAKTVSVFDGSFETPISLDPGENVVSISGRGAGDIYAAALLNLMYNPPTPTIMIENPRDGDVVDISRSPTVLVKGRVESRKNIVSAFLIQNGLPRHLKIYKDGFFMQKAVLLTDRDTFKVEVINQEGYSGVSEVHRVNSYGISRQHMMVILNWDRDGVDLDLNVKDLYGYWTSPESPDMFRSHRSIPEGRLELDDKDGFGPEIFLVTQSRQNSYDIYIQYYYGKRDTMAYVTVILFPDIQPKRIIKTFGPFKLFPYQDDTFITRVKMPEGLFLEGSHAAGVQ